VLQSRSDHARIAGKDALSRHGQSDAALRTRQGLPGCRSAGQGGAAPAPLRGARSKVFKYSAAWKLLGKALQADGDKQGAHEAWESGIAAANARGDKQAEKEMSVFLRRLDRLTPD